MIMLNHNVIYMYLKCFNLKYINAYSLTKFFYETKTLLRFADWSF